MPLKRRFSSPAPTVDSDAYKQNRAIHARGYISAARTASSLAFDGFPDAFPENVDLKRIKYGCAGRTASAVAPRRALVSEPRIKPAPLLPTARPIQQMTRKVPSESDDEDYMLEDVSTEQEEEEEKDDESMDTEEDTASSVSEKVRMALLTDFWVLVLIIQPLLLAASQDARTEEAPSKRARYRYGSDSETSSVPSAPLRSSQEQSSLGPLSEDKG